MKNSSKEQLELFNEDGLQVIRMPDWYIETPATPDTPVEASKKLKALKRQPGGEHYIQYQIQPIEYVLANKLGFCEGNVIKYISRWDKKGTPRLDLEKAKHYIDFLLDGLDENSL